MVRGMTDTWTDEERANVGLFVRGAGRRRSHSAGESLKGPFAVCSTAAVGCVANTT